VKHQAHGDPASFVNTNITARETDGSERFAGALHSNSKNINKFNYLKIDLARADASRYSEFEGW